MTHIYEDMAVARRLAGRAATLSMLNVTTEAGVASLIDAAEGSTTALLRARTFLDFGTDSTSVVRRRAQELLDTAGERRGHLELVAA